MSFLAALFLPETSIIAVNLLPDEWISAILVQPLRILPSGVATRISSQNRLGNPHPPVFLVTSLVLPLHSSKNFWIPVSRTTLKAPYPCFYNPCKATTFHNYPCFTHMQCFSHVSDHIFWFSGVENPQGATEGVGLVHGCADNHSFFWRKKKKKNCGTWYILQRSS